jgi:hypothetical protein
MASRSMRSSPTRPGYHGEVAGQGGVARTLLRQRGTVEGGKLGSVAVFDDGDGDGRVVQHEVNEGEVYLMRDGSEVRLKIWWRWWRSGYPEWTKGRGGGSGARALLEKEKGGGELGRAAPF